MECPNSWTNVQGIENPGTKFSTNAIKIALIPTRNEEAQTSLEWTKSNREIPAVIKSKTRSKIMSKIKNKILNMPLLLQILLGQLIIYIIFSPIFEYLIEEHKAGKLSGKIWARNYFIFSAIFTLVEFATIALHAYSSIYQGNNDTTVEEKSQADS